MALGVAPRAGRPLPGQVSAALPIKPPALKHATGNLWTSHTLSLMEVSRLCSKSALGLASPVKCSKLHNLRSGKKSTSVLLKAAFGLARVCLRCQVIACTITGL